MEEGETLLASQLPLLLLGVLFSFATSWMAWRNGFYTWPRQGEPSRTLPETFLSLRGLVAVFLFFLLLQAIIVPVIVYSFLIWQSGEPFDLSKPIPEAHQAWINIASMWIASASIWLFCYGINRPFFRSLLGGDRFKNDRLYALKNFAFGVLAWFVAFPLASTVGLLMELIVVTLFQPGDVDQVAVAHFKMTFGNPLQFWMAALGIITAVPAAEELIFRGFMQTWFKQKVGRGGAIVATSLIFAVFHYSSLHGWHNLELLPALFLLSCFLGHLFERQQNLWAPIGLHMVFNFVSVCLITFVGEGG